MTGIGTPKVVSALLAVVGTGVAVAWSAGPSIAATPASASLVKSCDFQKLESAISRHGTIDLDCSGTIAFPKTIVISSGRTTINAVDHSVIFDGGGSVQLFRLEGGQLTLAGLTLRDATVSGDSGSKGAAGQDQDTAGE